MTQGTDKKPMKILLVSDMYYPLPGGIPEHINHLYIEMKRMGHTVHILTGKSFKDKSLPNSDVKRYGHSIAVPANKSFSQITVGIRMFLEIKNLLSREKYDIVHIHGSLAPTLPLMVLFFSNTTNVITFHAAHNRSIGYEALKSPLSKFFKRIDGVIAVSNEAKRSVIKYFPGEYRIIPNGVDLKRFSPDNRKLNQFIDSRINILFVGRHDPRKGIKYLYKAMDYLIDEIPDIRLIVVGKGFMKKFYELSISENAKKHIVFENYVDYSLLPMYYTTADVFVSPATGGESFGIVLIEAMASGVPVIASNIRGYRQVARHRFNGFLVKTKDPQEIAKGIKEVLFDKELRKNLIENGLMTAQRYAWDRIAEEVVEFYRETIKEKSDKEKRGIRTRYKWF